MSTAVEVAPRVTRAKVMSSSGFMVARMPGPRSAWRVRLPTRLISVRVGGSMAPLDELNACPRCHLDRRAGGRGNGGHADCRKRSSINLHDF
jgi:hypothetical protein